MEILRFECAIGDKTYGPFTSHVFDETHKVINARYTHELNGHAKEPEEDGIDFYHGLLCGTINYMDLTEWLPYRNTITMMEEKGFRFAVYEVSEEHLLIGGSQVCWHPDHATLKEIMTIEEIADAFFKEDRFQVMADEIKVTNVKRRIQRRKRKK